MIHKYFPFDKNYLLEQAQFSLEKELLTWLIDTCKSVYLQENNPLGIMDDTALQITAHVTEYDERLCQFYADLCGVYRYRYGDNQLEFLFDGADHYTKYQNDWRHAFYGWTRQLCRSRYFLRAVLEITVFQDSQKRSMLAENRLRSYIEKSFNLRLYHYKGITEMEVA